jgi:lactosylceramide 4-alpha-galactosyltransferase
MIRKRKKIKLIISIPIILFLFNYSFLFLNTKFDKIVKNDSLCVENGLALTSQDGYGFFMDPKTSPTNWKTYYGGLRNETNLRIFFHETSGNNKLSILQCCSVESAAKHHPNRPVQLFVRPQEYCSDGSTTLSPFTKYNPSWLQVLSQYPNMSIILLNEKNYFFGTAMEDWYNNKKWRESPFERAHLSDYVRILSLYKGGGLYLDLDILTLKPYNGDIFRNFLVYGSARMDHISNGAMHMDLGHWLSEEIMQLLVKEYDPDSYVFHGPDAVSEVMKNVCGLAAGHPDSNQCTDIHLLSDNFFYPIPSIISGVLFQEGENTTHAEKLVKIKNSFGLHFWNSLSRLHKPFNIYSNQIISVLAHEHCPITVSMARFF